MSNEQGRRAWGWRGPYRSSSLCVLAAMLLFLCASWSGETQARAAQFSGKLDPNIALFYGKHPPLEALKAFDLVIIDPEKAIRPDIGAASRTEWGARVHVSFGNWRERDGSAQTASDAQADAVLRDVVALWHQGYRTFLLDDGSALDERDLAPDTEGRLPFLLAALKARLPDARIYLRNRVNLARRKVSLLDGVVIDSLYRRVTSRPGYLTETQPAVRDAVLAALTELDRHGLDVLTVDYCPVDAVSCRRELAGRLSAAGLKPYVTSPQLDVVGIGRIEVLPRKIAVIQSLPESQPLMESAGSRHVALPLNYLGYDLKYVDVARGLPSASDFSADRYAGIVVVMDGPVRFASAWRNWFLDRVRAGMPVAVLGDFGFQLDAESGRILGLKIRSYTGGIDVDSIVYQAPMIGLEILPAPNRRLAQSVAVGDTGSPLLTVGHGSGQSDIAALTSWGGYALHPYTIVSQPALGWSRWALDPLTFFKQALRLPEMPVPDVTTENGRRLMFVQVSDEGFEGHSELPGTPYNGEVMYAQVLRRYHLPITLVSTSSSSIVAPQLLDVKQKIHDLPYVRTVRAAAVVPDMVPKTDVLTRSTNSWTKISPYGVAHPAHAGDFQIFAPGASDYAYFGSASGPFYGYQRALESFELSNSPYRFTPVHLFFHAASMGKAASLRALNTVYSELLKGPVLPVYTSDYLDRVNDWRHVSVARQGDDFVVRSGAALRQLRWNGASQPELSDAAGLAGFSHEGSVTYMHMGSDEARFRMSAAPAQGRPAYPYISQASGFIREFQQQGSSIRLRFGGYYRPFLRLENIEGCRAYVDGRAANLAHTRQISVPAAAGFAITYHTIEVMCG